MGDLMTRIHSEFKKDDYLLIVGDPIFIGLAMSVVRDVLLDAEEPTMNVLRYDKALGRYLDIEVEV